MTEIRRVLKQASWRLILIDMMRNLTVTASAAVALLIGILFAQRVMGFEIGFPGEWAQLGAAALGAAVLAAVVWSLIRRARGVALARIVDERAELRESLSTAMYVSDSRDPWANMVVESARDKARRIDVRRAIPLVAPRLWFVPLALMLSMVILWFSLPNWDLLGRISEREAEQRDQYALQQVHEEVKPVADLEERLRQRGIELADDEAGDEGKDAQGPQTPDEIRRAAIRRLTNLQDRLQDMKQGEDGQRMDAMRQMMRQLRVPGPGPAEQLARAMAQGNFEQAQQELQQLAQQLASAELSPEDLERLQEQLQRLAEQMQQLAENRQELERQLQQAGMTAEQAQQAARDPEALQQALEQMEHLTEEQKKQLAETAKALSEACSMCSSMGSALAQMAEGMSEAGMSQSGMEGFEGLSDQLSALEMAQADLDAMDAAMSDARQQLSQLGSACSGDHGDGQCEGGGDCAGMGCEDCDGSGGSSPWRLGGGSGLGEGGGTSVRDWGDVPEAPTTVERVKSPSRTEDGPIIGTRLVYGDQVRGESVAEFASVVESSTRAATEALEGMHIPRELHPAVKTYFGRLEARARAQRPTEDAEAAESTEEGGRE